MPQHKFQPTFRSHDASAWPYLCSLGLPQNLLASIRKIQGKLQESHERSKVVTRGADMRTLRDAMQVLLIVPRLGKAPDEVWHIDSISCKCRHCNVCQPGPA